mgnify:FL=1
MQKPRVVLAGLILMSLAGCLQTDGERALAGAAVGAAAADALDENALTGAAIGGLAGTFCDDVNLCPGGTPRY